jgi:hypothetical protein
MTTVGKGSIFVATYSRSEDLDRSLNSIVAARGTRNIPLIVIHQQGFAEVTEVISKWREHIQILIETEAQGVTPLQNINLNSLLGREISFSWLNSDWCIGVEDDVQISLDSIDFVECMYNKYHKNYFFRGVNLGSKNAYKAEQLGAYTKLSFGIHGQASMITKQTWKHFNVAKLRSKSDVMGLDAMMELFSKTGFMCTPYNSRYLDNGWNGTHSSKDPNDRHYQLIRDSFYKGQDPRPLTYSLQKFETNWRQDSRKFSYFKIVPIFVTSKIGHYRFLVRKYIDSHH